MNWLDKFFENSSRSIYRGTSRRHILAQLGAILVGSGAAGPLLPVARGRAAKAQEGGDDAALDPAACEYWRHCAIDGFLCGCCGGSASTCPPGTEPSPVTWIGTCLNPVDNTHYIISYFDCCGKTSCGRCMCNRNEGERPIYVPHLSNDIDWCVGGKAGIVYNCSTAVVIGVAEDA